MACHGAVSPAEAPTNIAVPALMIQQTLIRLLRQAARAASSDLRLDGEAIPDPELSRPKQKRHGDWATNLALVLAPKAGRPPREVAEAIVRNLPRNDVITSIEVAGPGFINLFLGHSWLHDVIREILDDEKPFGRAGRLGQRVQVEYVSANPTGPLHVGTARNAALGDSVANVLDAAGYDVEREYYYNDSGRQLELFGESVEVRYLQHFGVDATLPEDGYRADYVVNLAQDIETRHGDSLVSMEPAKRRQAILAEAVKRTMEGIEATLERFGIRMDTWVSERELLETGAVDRAVERLQTEGHAYRSEGAIFFRSTSFGDEKDRVLIRSNGEPTYFAKDCAYVLHKAARGFTRMIYVWGADHHGTVKRLLGAADAFGVNHGRVEILLYQLVNLYRGGEAVRMSRRAGDYVTLDELLDEVGPDAARYTLLTRSADSALDFDIEAVKRQTLDNPVYYVQYAHARIASLLRMAEERGVELRPWKQASFEALTHQAELDLLRRLAEFPEVVDLAAQSLAPHRLTRYAEQVAADFHRFYTECRVITDDESLTEVRLWLSEATKRVVAGVLALIGVSAPQSMERIGDEGS
jgi:arginyl-tRNA synthetase